MFKLKLCLLLHSSVLTEIRSELIIVGVVLAAVALSEAMILPNTWTLHSRLGPRNVWQEPSMLIVLNHSFTHLKIQYTRIESICSFVFGDKDFYWIGGSGKVYGSDKVHASYETVRREETTFLNVTKSVKVAAKPWRPVTVTGKANV